MSYFYKVFIIYDDGKREKLFYEQPEAVKSKIYSLDFTQLQKLVVEKYMYFRVRQCLGGRRDGTWRS